MQLKLSRLLEILQNSSNLFTVQMLWLSLWFIVRECLQLPSISQLDILKAITPSDSLSLSQLTVNPVPLLTAVPQYSHRYLNIFCVLPCHKTFSNAEDKICHSVCYTIQFMHYSHFKTHSLQHLKPIKC